MTEPTTTARPVARVRDALEAGGCEPRGPEHKFMARCPAHDDHDPSLSVSEGSDGRALVHCFAGCPTESVLAELGLAMRELFASDSLDRWPCSARDRWARLAGRFDETCAQAAHERRRDRDARTFGSALVQLARNGREFTGSLAFTCPWCEQGHAWIRRNGNGFAADCDAGCQGHEVLEALAGLGAA